MTENTKQKQIAYDKVDTTGLSHGIDPQEYEERKLINDISK